MTATSLPTLTVGSWAFCPTHGESVRILDVESVWNHTVYQVWIPRLATVERVPAESLTVARPAQATGLDRITYAVAAARIADALTQDVLLAPLKPASSRCPTNFTLSPVRWPATGFATCSPMRSAWARPSRPG